MKRALIAFGLAFVACGSSEAHDGGPPETTVDLPPASAAPSVAVTSVASAAPVASVTASAIASPDGVAPPASPTTITVTEGKPEALPGGGTVAVGKIIYAHLSGDKNLSVCEVTITRNGKTETKRIERQGPITFTMIAGLRVGVDGVDPYHQPSTATLVIGP